MPTIDYKPFANTLGANVESQAAYLISLAPGGDLVDGFQSGTAQSAEANKVFRQSSMISAALANVVSNALAADLLDDGDLAALILKMTQAIGLIAAAGSWSTGDVKLTMKNVADSGWVFCNDGTIGDAASSASTRANADCQALFALLWNNVSDTYAPVVGGRGVSAAADWAAHKKITLTKMMGRVLGIAGAGAGLTARALGQNLGEEQHILTIPELPVHNHGIVDPGHVHGITDPGHAHTLHGSFAYQGGAISWAPNTDVNPITDTSAAVTGITVNAATTGITVSNTGAGTAFNNMQPTSFCNAMIKL